MWESWNFEPNVTSRSQDVLTGSLAQSCTSSTTELLVLMMSPHLCSSNTGNYYGEANDARDDDDDDINHSNFIPTQHRNMCQSLPECDVRVCLLRPWHLNRQMLPFCCLWDYQPWDSSSASRLCSLSENWFVHVLHFSHFTLQIVNDS